MDETQLQQYRKRLFIVSLVIFVICLTQHAFFIDRSDYDGWSSPIGLILVGWLPLLSGEASALSWLANPLLLFSWISLFKLPKATLWTSLAALLLGLSFLSVEEIMSSEAPTYSKVTEIKAGYWLWLLSMLVLVIGVVYLEIRRVMKR